MKKTIAFCSIWVFLSTNGLVVKDQEVRGQVSTTSLEGPSYGLTYDEKSLVKPHFYLALLQLEFHFFSFWDHSFDFGSVLKVTPKRWKKAN